MNVVLETKIAVIDERSLHLSRAKELHRANSKRLGMFPAGAFEDHAVRRQILGAIGANNLLIGYLLYRIAKERAMIVHLCVDNRFQRGGVSRLLIDRLIEITKAHGLRGIGLKCRRDYEATHVWPRLGFIPLTDKPGKSIDQHELTFWWLDHHQPDLFQTGTEGVQEEERLSVVMDANVFFDITDEDTADAVESKALLADWLQDSIELCLTDEIYNEINRNDDSKAREQMRGKITAYRLLAAPQVAATGAINLLNPFFPQKLSSSDESDLRQLSKAIACGVQIFVTRDEALLAKTDDIYLKTGLSVLRPTALINRLDSLRREADYQPVRLGGSRFKTRLVTSADETKLTHQFHASGKESAHQFSLLLRSILAAPRQREATISQSENGEILALHGYCRTSPGVLEIPLFRLASNNLAPTVARHLLARALQVSAGEDRDLTVVSDPAISGIVATALAECGFSRVSRTWLKINLGGSSSAAHLTKRLEAFDKQYTIGKELSGKIAGSLREWQATPSRVLASEIERMLWPAKISDAEIPTFIVPIRATWAQNLFDEGLANQELFGARPELVLKREQVYYRANQACGLETPGRILWYVSGDENWQGTMRIRACSRLDEVIIEKPRDLFRRFRRLGTYEWKDVMQTAKGDHEKPIMALRFSDTELFKSPVSRDAFRKMGIKSNLQSPVRITRQQFADIYEAGRHS
nr:GNAT family N-acetyltransferase [Nitrosomonas nitrosa]